CTRGEFW
nr:immunoglobulin heavy chain junction region [Macaca mulatta]MOV50283.1 immunoglobulin heavy chain junction region [Macaca mulatta]MOV50463.1 immunoglobulin heavy chain junction region [Macaca mulatta]MOV52389.1 immunoglobulin heavy chain junction region [Macaca mulatta]